MAQWVRKIRKTYKAVRKKASGGGRVKNTLSHAALKLQVRRMKSLKKDSMKFIAHRGLSALAPENTAKAFELAGKAGFWGAETDIHVTKDGEYILLHDDSLSRMFGVEERPENLTLSEIRSLKMVSGNNLERYEGDESAVRICTLKDYLEICKKYGMVPVIEIKIPCGANPTLKEGQAADRDGKKQPPDRTMCDIEDIVKDAMGDAPYTYISFNKDVIREMDRIRRQRARSNVTLQLLFKTAKAEELREYLAFCKTHNASWDFHDNANSEKQIRMIHKAGLYANAWTVNDPDRAALLNMYGMDYITTNVILWQRRTK